MLNSNCSELTIIFDGTSAIRTGPGAGNRLRDALEATLPQLEWANIHGSRCEELPRAG